MVELRHKTFGAVSSAPLAPEVKDSVVNDLQSLIELGCVKDSIKLGDLEFTLRSLNASERIDLSKFLGDTPAGDSLFQFNIRLLSLAIESINGKSLESFHPAFDANKDVFILRSEIISSLQAPVISKLLEFYNSIAERSDKNFESVLIKN